MKMEVRMINVIFDPGKGNLSLRSREAEVGTPIGELPTPVRSGYAFAGWYVGEEEITATTPVCGEEDLRLTAKWVKKTGESKKLTMYKRQKKAAVLLSVVAVILAISLVVTNLVVQIYGVEDVYYTESGKKQTEKYYIRKDNGVYAMFSRDGERMKTDEDGNFLTKSGNVYYVDPETGDYELYAVVDYDGANGEVLNAQKTRVMMFKRISQDNILSIKVTNDKGSYEFYRDDNGRVQIRGVEDAVVSYDGEAYANLCVDTGYALSMEKLDFTSPHAPKNPDGSINYDAYGLADRYDAEGNLTYTPAVYTITGVPDNETQPVTHTVQVGDPLVSGGGYYVRRVGHDAVYIMDAGLGSTVLQPVESMVTPMVVYPISASLYMEAYEFVMAKANIAAAGSTGNLKDHLQVLVSFTSQELASRLHTMYSSSPYVPLSEPWASTPEYAINDYNVSTIMANMFEMEFLGCRKLGITDEKGAIDPQVLKDFHLDGEEVYYITYASPMIDSSGALIKDEDGEQLYADNRMLISPKTEQGTYYVASLLCDMVVEVDQYYFSFLDWEISDWYHQYFYTYALAYVQNMKFTVGDKTYTFSMDNSLSYAYYEKDGSLVQANISQGRLEQQGNSYVYTTSTGSYPVKFVDMSNKDNFVYKGGTVYYKDPDGKTYQMNTSTNNIKVYMDEYTDRDGGHLLDYVITNTFVNDKGETETEQITAVDNFRQWIIKLCYASIEGDVDEKEFEANLGMSIKEYFAQGDDVCQATLQYKLKDMASILNQYYTTDDKGNSVKLWTEDNEREAIIRFYRYSERKSLMTIENIEGYDENGNPITDPTKAIGTFYVLSSYVEELAKAADMVLNGQLIPDA